VVFPGSTFIAWYTLRREERGLPHKEKYSTLCGKVMGVARYRMLVLSMGVLPGILQEIFFLIQIGYKYQFQG
jgi:hypothetical protein